MVLTKLLTFDRVCKRSIDTPLLALSTYVSWLGLVWSGCYREKEAGKLVACPVNNSLATLATNQICYDPSLPEKASMYWKKSLVGIKVKGSIFTGRILVQGCKSGPMKKSEIIQEVFQKI